MSFAPPGADPRREGGRGISIVASEYSGEKYTRETTHTLVISVLFGGSSKVIAVIL